MKSGPKLPRNEYACLHFAPAGGTVTRNGLLDRASHPASYMPGGAGTEAGAALEPPAARWEKLTNRRCRPCPSGWLASRNG